MTRRAHALVCLGRLHAAVDPIMKPWDSAALVPCIREAGGVAIATSGGGDGVVDAGSLITCCDPGLAAGLVDALHADV